MNRRIAEAVKDIEPPQEDYICPRLNDRCLYFGGNKYPCPDNGAGKCMLAQKWFDKLR